jgi:acetyl esterase/lipase
MSNRHRTGGPDGEGEGHIMAYALDPELVPVMAALAEPAATAPARGDWRALREQANAGLAYLATLAPPSSGVTTATYMAAASDGADLELRWYTTGDPGPGSAVLYAHGGGLISGSLDLYDAVLSGYVARTGVPFLAVDYRLAPEASGTTLAQDVFSGLTWLLDHARELGVDPRRIAVMGDSGGAGPAAASAIIARDRGIALAGQLLIYPMLDDRTQTPDRARVPFLTWTYDNNFTSWRALLGEQLGGDSVSPLAAPARLTDFAGLAPAYLDVGDLDIFRDETITYALNLARAGVPTELHLHPGVPHGWERFVPNSATARRALADRVRAISSI